MKVHILIDIIICFLFCLRYLGYFGLIAIAFGLYGRMACTQYDSICKTTQISYDIHASSRSFSANISIVEKAHEAHEVHRHWPIVGQGLPRDVLTTGCQLVTGHPLQLVYQRGISDCSSWLSLQLLVLFLSLSLGLSLFV